VVSAHFVAAGRFRGIALFLVSYVLLVGPSQHYAPSASAAIGLVREIKSSGGQIKAIVRTATRQEISEAELALIAEREGGPRLQLAGLYT